MPGGLGSLTSKRFGTNAGLGHAVYDFLGDGARHKTSLSTDSRRLIWARIQKPRIKFKIENALHDSVFGPTASQFKRQMQWLKHNTRLVSEQIIVECLRSKKTLTKPCALVTFDDGYRDN